MALECFQIFHLCICLALLPTSNAFFIVSGGGEGWSGAAVDEKWYAYYAIA